MFILTQTKELVAISDLVIIGVEQTSLVFNNLYTENKPVNDESYVLAARYRSADASPFIKLFIGSQQECNKYRSKIINLLKKHDLLFD